MNGAVAFYSTSLKYVLKNMKLSGSLWEHSARWSDVEHVKI